MRGMRNPRRVQVFLKRYAKNRGAVIGIFFLFFIIFVALFEQLISPYEPLQTLTGEPLEAPSMRHLMGTDNVGKDVFTGVIYGSRVSLFMGFLLLQSRSQ